MSVPESAVREEYAGALDVELGDLIIRQVGAVALAGETQTLLEHLDDLVVAHTLIFGELVDAQHERGYLDL